MPLPGRCHDNEHRTTEQRQFELVLHLLCIWTESGQIGRVDVESLHRAFPFFLMILHGLEVNVDDLHFYRDGVSGKYKALDQALSDGVVGGYWGRRSGDRTPKVWLTDGIISIDHLRQKILNDAEDKEKVRRAADIAFSVYMGRASM